MSHGARQGDCRRRRSAEDGRKRAGAYTRLRELAPEAVAAYESLSHHAARGRPARRGDGGYRQGRAVGRSRVVAWRPRPHPKGAGAGSGSVCAAPGGRHRRAHARPARGARRAAVDRGGDRRGGARRRYPSARPPGRGMAPLDMLAVPCPTAWPRESSPYLLQHANNPVDWFPWGEEAFARAGAEDKPIFLSVGYSTCHWCHVMEHESFENDGDRARAQRAFRARSRWTARSGRTSTAST